MDQFSVPTEQCVPVICQFSMFPSCNAPLQYVLINIVYPQFVSQCNVSLNCTHLVQSIPAVQPHSAVCPSVYFSLSQFVYSAYAQCSLCLHCVPPPFQMPYVLRCISELCPHSAVCRLCYFVPVIQHVPTVCLYILECPSCVPRVTFCHGMSLLCVHTVCPLAMCLH